MELKLGYQQTEVGVIPEDWVLQPLSYLTILMTNGFVGPVKSHYTERDDGVLYIQGYNVEENNFNFNGIKYVTLEFHKKQSKSCLREGDLLTIQTGDVGLTSYVQSELAGSNCHALIITRFKDKYSPKFFSYYLNSNRGRARLKEIETGTTMKHINVGDMVQFLVPHPPTKTEQTAIADTLSDADALIQSLTSLIAKKRQIKQGAMQTLLNPYENGRLKEGWVVKKLEDCLDKIVGGGTPSRSVKGYWGKEIPWVTVKDFSSFSPFSTQEYITTEGLKHSATNIIPRGTIIIATRMALGKSVVYDVDVCINQDLKAIFPKSAVSVLYLKHWLDKNAFLIEELGSGSTVMGVSLEDLRKIEFSMPSKENQIRIATILSDMDAEIAALETKLAKYRHIKQGMMQNLLTGRIRLV